MKFLAVTLASSAAFSQARTRFWNLTHMRISEFYLAPAGTTTWGPNQAKNDKDGVADPDERLTITGTTRGQFQLGPSPGDLQRRSGHERKLQPF